MDTATAGLLSDAVKILGPAIVAAWATYKVSRAQFEIKLKELDRTHEFRAREILFLYGKERQAQVAKDSEGLSRTLGMLLAEAVGDCGRTPDEQGAHLSILTEVVERYSKDALADIEATVREMQRQGMQDTEDYAGLVQCTDRVRNLELAATPERLKDYILTILDVYSTLHRCTQALLWKQMEGLLAGYTEC